MERKFVVKKDAVSDVITYMEYEKLKGFNVKPKDNMHFDDMINVNEMVIINPTLIEKLVSKKCKRTMEKIITMTSVIDSADEDDSDSFFGLILDEVARFKALLMNKYVDYMEKEEYKLLMKKLEIIEKEVKLRKSVMLQDYMDVKKSKSSR